MLFFAGMPAAGSRDTEPRRAMRQAEFVFSPEQSPTEKCHAPTIAETPQGLVTAWYGGSREGHPDTGIWVSLQTEGKWSVPVEIARGERNGRRMPCWNPVLAQLPDGPLLLFYKTGPSPKRWRGMMKRSYDGGLSWTDAEPLPDGIYGPAKNKPVLLDDGTLLCGGSTEAGGWKVHFERSPDRGKTWTRTEPIGARSRFDAIQPALFPLHDGQVQALCRSRQRVIVETRSFDYGKTWTPLIATSLPNPNSGIDGMVLADGRRVLVYNDSRRRRTPLVVALSPDGVRWRKAAVLEVGRGPFSYPAVIQTKEGFVHITYTYQRRMIKHVVLDPSEWDAFLPSSAKEEERFKKGK
ncbi:MAG: sialidase [Candidatus Omnitrophica bacterium]|nr:sialidase [Candidatus Omnitrophota bacterium]